MFRYFLIFSFLCQSLSLNINQLIPYGIEHSDHLLQFDSSTNLSESISFSNRYSFFNEFYDEIRLSPHGLILFGPNARKLSHSISIARSFPIEDFVCVAPFWIETNLDQQLMGKIFYREVSLKNDGKLLHQITKIVRNGFPNLSRQSMLWSFIVTWHEMINYQNQNQRNTFQTILTTNGFYSFIILNYGQIQWSEDLTNHSALIGFNAGDNRHFYQMKKSLSPAIVDVINQSNIGQLGRFVYHTSGQINDVQCETSTGLQSSPFRGSIYGGYSFRLFGICFTQLNYQIRIDGQIIDDCQVLNSLYIVCQMPMLMDSGKLKIELFYKENQSLIDSTDFLAHVPEDNGELILRNYVNLTQQIADPHNDQLILQFQSNEITRKYLFRLIIYDYATQLSSSDQTLFNRTRKRIDLGYGYLNLSSIDNLTIPYENIFSVQHEPSDRVHALQISFEIIHKDNWIQSALFLGAKIFTAAASLHVAYCPAWILIQRDPKEYIEQVPPCPCHMTNDPWLEEHLGFHIDEGCDGRKPIAETCQYHSKARSCYRKKSEISWAGAQCCYNEQGNFIEHGQEGAGTLDLVSPDANTWLEKSFSMFGHFFSDFLSYWSCCRSLLISEKMCQAYYNYRPAGRCEDLELESIEKYANLQFVTLNGSSLTVDGQGEFTLLSLPQWDGQEVQIRLQANSDSDSSPTNGSIGIVAFVIGFLNGKKRVQFEVFPSHQHFEIHIDGRLIEYPDEDILVPLIIYEDEFVRIKRKSNGKFKITFPRSPFRFCAHVRPSFDFLELETLLDRDRFRKLSTPSFGLLGDLDGLIFSNGTRFSISNETDQTILDEFAQSWRVPENSSLFFYLNTDNRSYLNQPIQIDCDQQQNEFCTKDSSIETDLYHADQLHLESLTVTVQVDVILPHQKSRSTTIHQRYSYLIRFFFLCLCFVLI